MLGQACVSELTRTGEYVVASPTHDELDITNRDAMSEFFVTWRPTHVVNAAAYTSVDGAETNQDACRKVNVQAVEHLLTLAQKNHISVSHISTASVFDGPTGAVHHLHDTQSPVNYYSVTKKEAEDVCSRFVKLGHHVQWPRLYWLYESAASGFVGSVLAQATSKGTVHVVRGQSGQPTLASYAAHEVISLLLDESHVGPVHITPSGTTSRIGWVEEILRIFHKQNATIIPVDADFFPGAARRPEDCTLSWSPSERAGRVAPDWSDHLKSLV